METIFAAFRLDRHHRVGASALEMRRALEMLRARRIVRRIAPAQP
jgi:hypothetical protein